MTLFSLIWMAFAASANIQAVEEKYQELIANPEVLEKSATEVVDGTSIPSEALTYKDLYRDNISIQQKWDILSDIAERSPEFAKKIYLSSIESTDWLLRVGGIKFLAAMDANLATEKARKLIESDTALLVRSAAVDVLVELQSIPRVKEILWEAMKDQKNFHKGQSLWIRQNIAMALQNHTDKSDNENWANYLDDKDVMVRTSAVLALEKNNQVNLGSMSDTLDIRSALWKARLEQSALTELNPIAEQGVLQDHILSPKPIKTKSSIDEPLLKPDAAAFDSIIEM